MAWVKIHNEVKKRRDADWILCFQECTYHYDDGSTEDGYRFIYRTSEGKLRPFRGQARIPNARILNWLIRRAEKEGWLK